MLDLLEQTPEGGEGQGSLVCCSPWGSKESGMTWWLNNNNLHLVTWMGFPGGTVVKNPFANAGDRGSTPGSGYPLEEEIATHSSLLAWKIPWTEEPGGLHSMRSQRVGHDWSDFAAAAASYTGGSDAKESACDARETWVQSLGWEDPLEEEMATHSSLLAWKIPWTEESGGLQSTGSQKSQTRLKWLNSNNNF